MAQSSKNTLDIPATPEAIYQALTTPSALETWQAPADMTAKVHRFDLRVGGGYEMSLYYPSNEAEMPSISAQKEDRFTARFTELVPNQKVTQAINFHTQDPDFMGEMTFQTTLEPIPTGTRVTMIFTDIPKGIKPSDNEAGTADSLRKLAEYVTGQRSNP